MRRIPEFKRIGQREIDDAGLAAEIDRRLGAAVGEFLQAASPTAGENIGHCIAGKWLNAFFYHCSPPTSLPVLRFKHDRRQRRQGDRCGDGAAGIDGLNAAAIAFAAAAIDVGIGIQDFAPAPLDRQAAQRSSRDRPASSC